MLDRALEYRPRAQGTHGPGRDRRPARPPRHRRADLSGSVRRPDHAGAAVSRRASGRWWRPARIGPGEGGLDCDRRHHPGPHGCPAPAHRDPQDEEPRAVPNRDHPARDPHRPRHGGGRSVARTRGVSRRTGDLGVRLRSPGVGGAAAVSGCVHFAVLRRGRNARGVRLHPRAPGGDAGGRTRGPGRQDGRRVGRPGGARLRGPGRAARRVGRLAGRGVLFCPRAGRPGHGTGVGDPLPDLPRGRRVHHAPDAVPVAGWARPDRPAGAAGAAGSPAAGVSSLRDHGGRATAGRSRHHRRVRTERPQPCGRAAVDRGALPHCRAERANRTAGALQRRAGVLR